MKELDLNTITDDIIISIFVSEKTGIIKAARTSEKWLNKHPNIKTYLLNRYSDSSNIVEIIYRIKNKLDIHPICPECGKPVNFKRFTDGYHKFCSNKCVNKNIQTKNKIANTKLEKYGDAGYHNTEKMKQTNIEKYGTECTFGNKDVQYKSKQTCLEKYGVENILQSNEFRKKIQQTCLEKYGVKAPNLFGSNEYKENIFKKYGVKYVSQIPAVQEKIKQKCLEKYGVEYYQQSDKARQHLSEINKSKEVQAKMYNTRKKNNSFHTSQVEKLFKEYLEQNYPNDFEYQYRSELYPFNCDFYIKSLDLYIEINGSWTHGGHAFDENNQEDIIRLNEMKSKNTQYYNNAIKTWTIRDVNKRNIAKENNLNYLEIFTKYADEAIKQFNEYIKH